jgi:hypothetical protein
MDRMSTSVITNEGLRYRNDRKLDQKPPVPPKENGLLPSKPLPPTPDSNQDVKPLPPPPIRLSPWSTSLWLTAIVAWFILIVIMLPSITERDAMPLSNRWLRSFF